MVTKTFLSILTVLFFFTSCEQFQKKAREAFTPRQERAKVATFARSAELGMVEYTVVKIIKANDVADWYKIGDRKILFNCKATLKAGIDLKEFSEKDVIINRATKSVEITLPSPKLLNLDIKPDDIKLVYENVTMFRSGFSASDRNKLLIQGENDIRESVEELGVLADAEKNASLYFEAMLKQMGYKSVTVNFKKEG